jgi:hypothetical protein
MDTPAQSMSDFTVLAIVLAVSAAAIPVALVAASRLRLDRFAQRLSSPKLLSGIAALTLGVMSLCVLLGIVPLEAVFSWWGAVPAAIAVLGTLVLVSIAATSKPREKAAGAQRTESESGKLAA